MERQQARAYFAERLRESQHALRRESAGPAGQQNDANQHGEGTQEHTRLENPSNNRIDIQLALRPASRQVLLPFLRPSRRAMKPGYFVMSNLIFHDTFHTKGPFPDQKHGLCAAFLPSSPSATHYSQSSFIIPIYDFYKNHNQ